jgi:hypothetical protein
VNAERCANLFRDDRLREAIWSECRRHSHDEEMQADFFASAWAWISSSAPDDLDVEAVEEFALCAVRLAYRHELANRKLTRTLLEICIVEEAEIVDFEPYAGRADAGTLLRAPNCTDGENGD